MNNFLSLWGKVSMGEGGREMRRSERCYECRKEIIGEPVWGYGSDTMSLFDKTVYPHKLLGGHHGIEKSPQYDVLYAKYGTSNPFLCRDCLAELWDTLIFGENDLGSVMQNPYRTQEGSSLLAYD
ncbi:MAG: hypothetical protein A3I88_01140 [Candidatus Portnoybacteria bacterium RIFCSPLOWO2_12_FULL_39_9]|uniref:Uncharacterized protein n=1 Tax=Candidatus Portnoybacteria bacterium RIFCSPHIGHO2_12_FULL_38_9 TaxID=1801997 RepID=A0A1G2FHC1_9BACT|nr:MAG: hypothetical protein A2646_00200 [Candidatus Portnoybacteria bacterium RIFCSPHIGHO2_02_FULL_39_12]OGZ37484.1 MAG: hypothetical protein A3J64_00625 [Candidatus Portnoybacteria bacterium RIFCSPHIGHO2_12_FULL_38_9]OGZ39130.1 MAG: hypothetical protein A3F21_00200 [Candidatus Portnoybacteria bacterium RIFCSPLOWO2_01_FULL_38_39]OGZ39824.1 MAG: hypothetical protein A3I88_01140 [Candidatus Portnoybacteria bacterium RIFCSPLOWO2_12_FULL_39_9]